MYSLVSIIYFVFTLFIVSKCEICQSPQFFVRSYSTIDARLTIESFVQLEINVKCKTDKQPNMLYADVQGQIIPCAQSYSSPGKFFISLASKELPRGRVSIKLYDDESYSVLRKARTADTLKAVKSFGEVEFFHPSASYGAWLASEYLAVIIFGLIWWIAYQERTKILV